MRNEKLKTSFKTTISIFGVMALAAIACRLQGGKETPNGLMDLYRQCDAGNELAKATYSLEKGETIAMGGGGWIESGGNGAYELRGQVRELSGSMADFTTIDQGDPVVKVEGAKGQDGYTVVELEMDCPKK